MTASDSPLAGPAAAGAAVAASDHVRLGAVELIRRFVKDRGDDDFTLELAHRAVDALPPFDGLRVADIGSGPGHHAAVMADRGATVACVDIDFGEVTQAARVAAADPRVSAFCGDAGRLAFADGSFDAVLCSNMLEHTPTPLDVLDEIGRIVRPGGWAWVSWTNWLSPWGGHAIAPLHYLGAERGLRVWRRLFGEPTGKNLPFDGVWPLHISTVLDHLADHDTLTLERVEPRYYPWLRGIMKVPGAREIVSWNCVLHLKRRSV